VRLECGSIVVEVESDDEPAAEWLCEIVDPWFTVSARPADARIRVSTDPRVYAELARSRPDAGASKACLALDQRLVAMPAWQRGDALALADDKRGCFIVVSPQSISVVGDAASRRWRFTLQLVLIEIAATRLRRAGALDLHAAAIEHRGHAIAFAGPKGSGKTTLSLHLLRAARGRWIANDRAFAIHDGTGFVLHGVPVAVKIQPGTLAHLPELGKNLAGVERPFLRSLTELAQETGPDAPPDLEIALSPAQLARRLGVEPLGLAPLGALVFPEIRADRRGFGVERLDAAGVRERLAAGLYGAAARRAEPTIFEEIDGGRRPPPIDLADALSEAVPGYRVVVGVDAYVAPDSGVRVLEAISP
jgi:hypothetical protein